MPEQQQKAPPAGECGRGQVQQKEYVDGIARDYGAQSRITVWPRANQVHGGQVIDTPDIRSLARALGCQRHQEVPDSFTHDKPSRAKRVRYWHPGTYEGQSRAQGSRVEAVHYLVVDVDQALDDDWGRTLQSLRGQGYAYLYHTTLSHGQAEGRTSARLIIPLARTWSGSPAEWRSWRAAALHELGLPVDDDPQTMDITRGYYAPAVGESWSDYYDCGRYLDGAALDPDSIEVKAGHVGRHRDAQASADGSIPEGQRNDTLYRLACGMRGRGDDEGEILARLRAVNSGRCLPPVDDAELQRIAGSAANHTPDARPSRGPKLIEADLCQMMAERHRDQIAYVADEDDWRVWDGQCWRPRARSHVERLAQGLAVELADQARQRGDDAMLTWAGRYTTHGARRSLVRGLELERMLQHSIHDYDSAGYVLAVRNGLIDMRDGTFRPGHRPSDRNSYVLPVDYEPEADGPASLLARTALEWMQGHAELTAYLQEIIAEACVVDTRHQPLVILYGPRGANGKSTLLDVMGALLGDLATTLPKYALIAGEHSRKQNSLARLRNKRLAVVNEIGRDELDADRLKAMTGGGGKVVSHRLHEDEVCTGATHSTWLVSNDRPGLPDTSAMRRRVQVVPFFADFSGRGNPNLTAQLCSAAELSAALRWIVAGSVRRYARGGQLVPPARCRQLAATMHRDHCPVREFLGAECEDVERGGTPTGQLLDAYRAWAGPDAQDITVSALGRALAKVYPDGRRSARVGGSARKVWPVRLRRPASHLRLVRAYDPETGEVLA